MTTKEERSQKVGVKMPFYPNKDLQPSFECVSFEIC